jgi:hypothetical protein
MHTWLAWQEVPGRPYGHAIAKKYLRPKVKPVDALIAWWTKLFFPESAR